MWQTLLTAQMKENSQKAISAIRFRHAVNVKNPIWVKPALLDEQIQKDRGRKAISKQSPCEQAKEVLYTTIKVEGLPAVDHVTTCQALMQKITEATQIAFTNKTEGPPKDNEWVIEYRRDGSFAQRISTQLPDENSLTTLIRLTHGSGVKVGGRNLSVEICSLHPQVTTAGVAAGNLVHAAGPTGAVQVLDGGQCL